MNQSKIDSSLESITNILIGASIAFSAQLVWFPLIDVHLSISDHLSTVAFFTVVSYTRSYYIRRLFNGRSIYQTLKRRIVDTIDKD